MKTNLFSRTAKFAGVAVIAASLAACAGGGVVTPGGQNAGVSGAAAGGSSVGADPTLERCAAPLGTIAMDDGHRRPTA